MKIHHKLEGLIAATFTPLDSNGEVNLSVIDTYADKIAASGIAGVFINGTTGESLSLTVSERKMLAVKWIEAANKRFKVIVHVGCNSLPEAKELAAHAQLVGADAIAAMAPSFFKPQHVKSLIDFFVPIAQSASDLPFYYYNMPSMTGVALSVPEFLREGKKRIPNLAGTKFTHNNLMEMAECLALEHGAFEVLHGYDEILITGLSLGATAGVGSTYNYLPEVYLGIIEAMKSNDIEKARELQMRSIEVVEIIIKYGGGVRGGKAIMNLIGVECGSCRLPIDPFTAEEYASLERDLKEINFL